MKSHTSFESLGYTAEDAYRNKSAADSRAEEIRRQEPGVQAVVFEDRDIPRGGLRYVVYVSGGNRRSDNPLKCSECGSPGVYKAGMCDECYGRKDNPQTKWNRRGYASGGDAAIDDVKDRKPKDDVLAKRRILNSLPADISHDNLNEWHDGFDEGYNKVYDRLARVSNRLRYGTLGDNPSWQGVKDRFRRGYHRARAAAMSPRVQSAISRFPQVAGAVATHVGLRDNPQEYRHLMIGEKFTDETGKVWTVENYWRGGVGRNAGVHLISDDGEEIKVDRRNLFDAMTGPNTVNFGLVPGSKAKLAFVHGGMLSPISLNDNPTGTISHRDIYEFNQYLKNATDSQVQGVYEKERAAGRTGYATLAKMELDRRGQSMIRSDNPSIKHDSDTKQYYHVRIRSPKRGEEFRTIEFKPDVKAVIGIHAKKGPRGGRSDIQKLLFSKDKFDIKGIKSWLKENGFGKLK